MADQSIIIKFKSTGDDKLIGQLEKLDIATKRLADKVSKYENEGKKAGMTNRLLSNSFATMRSHMLLFNFAMGLGIRQLIRFTRDAAKVQSMEHAFTSMQGGVTKASHSMDVLRKATDNTMSDFDLFQQSNNAMILGVTKNSEEMGRMFDMAQRLGAALGKDTKESVESLITGIGRQSRLMLDNIGIIVSSEKAYKNHATILKKSADQLTDAERKQAFLNATLASAQIKLQNLGDELLTTDQHFQRIGAASANLSKTIGDSLLPVVEPLADAFVELSKIITVDRLERFAAAMTMMAIAFIRAKIPVMTLTGLVAGFGAILAANPVTMFALGIGALTFGALELTNAFEGSNDTLDDYNEKLKEIAVATAALDDRIKKLNQSLSFQADAGANLVIAMNEEKLLKGDITDATKMQLDIDAKRSAWQEKNKLYMEEMEDIDTIGQVREENKLLLERQKIDNDQAKLDKFVFNQRISSVKEIGSATAKFGNILTEQAGKDKNQALMGLRLAYAGVLADSAAGLAKAYRQGGLAGATAGFAITLGLVGQLNQINAQIRQVEKMESGGMVGGRRHSQGGTMIEAEQGEFVMSRAATEAIGIENLNRLNTAGGGGGGSSIIINNPILGKDTIEDEIVPQIKEALRRGGDIN